MTVNIYDFNNQNNAILALIKAKGTNFRRVCEACLIHPSYFSRAMKSEASLSQQQIFRIAGFLEMTKPQKDYLFLLWNRQEAQDKEEREFFAQKIREHQEEKQKVSGKIKAKIISAEERKSQLEAYYSEAITALVHMYLTLPRFKNQPDLLGKELGLTSDKLTIELEKLEALGLIRRENSKVTRVEDSIHLPEDSTLSFLNHVNWRLKTIQEIERRSPRAGDYHLSVVFSGDEEIKFKLKQVLRDAVIKAQGLVGNCENPTHVFHMMMDLF